MPNIPPSVGRKEKPEWPQEQDPYKYSFVMPDIGDTYSHHFRSEPRRFSPEEEQWIHQGPAGSGAIKLPPHTPPEASPVNRPQSMKKGGMVHRTALYRLHAGERVLPRSMARRYMEDKHGGKMDAGSCQRD